MACNAVRYKSKTWLQGLTLADFTKFVDYILGERVAGLRLEQPPGMIVITVHFSVLLGELCFATSISCVRKLFAWSMRTRLFRRHCLL